jgi:hypothetical protein
MFRIACVCGLLLTGALAAQLVAQGDDKRVENPPRAMTAREIQARLLGPVSLPKGADANTPLHLFLEMLADIRGLHFLVDTQAFASQGANDVENQPVRLPPIDRIRTANVLREVLNQVGASYLIRSDHIDIIPNQARPEALPGGQESGGRALLPLVYAELDSQPLQDALREIANQAEASIVLDMRVADKEGKTAVTAALRNVPLESAVRLLANMAGLKAVRLDNVLYVTTAANARQIEKEQEHRQSGEPLAAGM